MFAFRLRILVILLAAAPLSACVTTGPLSLADRQALGRIGVNSALGDEFRLIHVGITVFNNKTQSVQVPGWGIDQFAERAVLKHLADSGVRNTGVLFESMSPRAFKARYVGGSKEQERAVLDEASRLQFDTVVLLTYAGVDLGPRLNGSYYGLYHLRKGSPCIFSIFRVYVYRVKDASKLAQKYLNTCSPIPSLPWKESFDDYSEEEKMVVRRQLESQITGQVQTSLTGFALTEQSK